MKREEPWRTLRFLVCCGSIDSDRKNGARRVVWMAPVLFYQLEVCNRVWPGHPTLISSGRRTADSPTWKKWTDSWKSTAYPVRHRNEQTT